MSVGEVLALVAVGVVAGLVSAVVSLATLVSYPALLAVGLRPLEANVTNTVALVLAAVGASVGSKRELAGQRRRVVRLGVLTAAGGATGAALLLLTPDRAFESLVPWLVGTASLVVLAQPYAVRLARSRGHQRSLALLFGVYGVAIYTGYFGAAGGVLMLAVLGALLDQPLAHINAAKNVIAGVANGVAAIGFTLFGPVRWAAAVPLALGFLLGGWLGPAVVRRLPAGTLRWAIAACGVAVAVKLGVDTYR